MDRENDIKRINREREKQSETKSRFQGKLKLLQNQKNFHLLDFIKDKDFIFVDFFTKTNKNKKLSILKKFLRKDAFPEEIKQKLTLYFLQRYNSQLLNSKIKNLKKQEIFQFQQCLSQLERAFIIDKILNSFFSVGSEFDEAYFKIVCIFDLYLQKCKLKLSFRQAVQLVPYFYSIACKYEGINQDRIIQLKKRFGQEQFKKSFNLDTEIRILTAINFKLSSPTVLIYIHQFFCTFLFILVMAQDTLKATFLNEEKDQMINLAKIILIDYKIAHVNPAIIALSIFLLGVLKKTSEKIVFQSVKEKLLSIYGLNFHEIDHVLQRVCQIYEELQKYLASKPEVSLT